MAKFCSYCGQKLRPDVEIRNCPKCGMELALLTDKPSSTFIEHVPNKNLGTAAFLAFIGGIFALPGLGHIYVRKVGMGIGILIGGFILYTLTFAIVISITSTRAYEAQNNPSGNEPFPTNVMISILSLVIGYIILFIWQILNARCMAKKFNMLAKTTGKIPW